MDVAKGRGAFTSMSGTLGGMRPNLALDGNTNPDYNAGSCSYGIALITENAWWMVDLGAVYGIHNVTIFSEALVRSG